MRYEYDSEADAAYVSINELPHAYSREIDETRIVDYAKDDTVIGVELLYVSSSVDVSDLPFASEIGKLLQEHKVRVFA